MNYTQKGVRAKQQALYSKSEKWGRKFSPIPIPYYIIPGQASEYRYHPVFHDIACATDEHESPFL